MKKKTIQEKWVETFFPTTIFLKPSENYFFFVCRAQWKINSQEDLSLLLFTPLEGTKMLFIFFSTWVMLLFSLLWSKCVLHLKKNCFFNWVSHWKKKCCPEKNVLVSTHFLTKTFLSHCFRHEKQIPLWKKKRICEFFFFQPLVVKTSIRERTQIVLISPWTDFF